MDLATQKDLEVLEKFKQNLKGKIDETDKEVYNDVLLLRFLRARELNLEKAEKMLLVAVEKKNCQFIKDLEPYEIMDILHEKYSVYFTDYDTNGRPVFYCEIGGWPCGYDLYKAGLRMEVIKSIAKGHVYIVYKQLMKTKCQELVFIVDLNGLTYQKIFSELRNITGVRDMYRMFQELEANFPEILHKAYVINAPTTIHIVVNLFKSIFPAHCLEKLEFFYGGDTSWQQVLNKELPSSCIPRELESGGTGEMTNIVKLNV